MHCALGESQATGFLKLIICTKENFLCLSEEVDDCLLISLKTYSNSLIQFVQVITWFRVQFGINKHKKIFYKTNKIAWAHRASAICGLWKN